jgi:hypothetical protein
MRRYIYTSALFILLVLILQIIVSMDWTIEHSMATGKAQAVRVGIPVPYTPEPEIESIQKYQVEHPQLGFLWKPSVTVKDNLVVGWGDIPAGAISTDDIGFINSEEATRNAREGGAVDIIGIGASYIGGAQNLFYDYFALNGYSYHNLAQGRFTFPQYNVALEKYGLALKPKWVIYGVNEVSFTLIPDYEGWKTSGMGWFAYHSGTWCGPAITEGFPRDYLKKFPRINNLYLGFMKKTFRGAFNKKPSRKELVDKTEAYILDAWNTCRENGVGFIALLIPSKVRMVQGALPSLYLFEELLPRLKKKGVPYIDLRDDYRSVDDPSQLYFRQDAHWNGTGVYRAARQILDFIEHKNEEPVP